MVPNAVWIDLQLQLFHQDTALRCGRSPEASLALTDLQPNLTVALGLTDEALIPFYFFMPLIDLTGIVGNLICLVVLLRQCRFSGFLYTCMRALAVTDICYLLGSIQSCIFISLGFYRSTNPTAIPNHLLAMYVWNFLTPLWHAAATASDFIVVLLTMARHNIMTQVDLSTTAASRAQTVRARICVAAAILTAYALYLPFGFQFELQECHSATPESTGWCYRPSGFTSSPVWICYGYLYQVVAKVLPIGLIFSVNVVMLLRVRSFWSRRRQWRRRRQNGCLCSEAAVLPPAGSKADGSSQNESCGAASRPTGAQDSTREIRIHCLILTLIICHCLFTIPGNVAFLLWTNFNDTWQCLAGKSTLSGVANILYSINYAKNFYLYCIAHPDIQAQMRANMSRVRRLLTCT